MSVDEVRARIERWRTAGEPYATAVLTDTWNSAPRRPGARFAVSGKGEIAGNVSAGCVEADLAERLAGVLNGDASGFVTYGVSDEQAHSVGLACGGTIRVYLEAAPRDDPVWPVLVEALESRTTVLLITDVSGGPAARHWLIDCDGRVLATDSPARPPLQALEEAGDLLVTGGLQLLESDGAPRAVVEVFLPSRRLVVVGATPVGAALARIAASAGFHVEVIEPRSAYAAELEGSGVGVDGRWPDEALADLAPDVSTAVAVVAHDARIDGSALSEVMRHPVGYVGLMGGGRTRRVRFEALRGDGVEEQKISRIRAPIGLDIGAESPAEIAVSILAQVVASWRGAG